MPLRAGYIGHIMAPACEGPFIVGGHMTGHAVLWCGADAEQLFFKDMLIVCRGPSAIESGIYGPHHSASQQADCHDE